uniref:Secreted protein n=1 Tax=Macrostomum lignano TaxID=282301 RepID=A0A1I8HDT9_9PLAT
RTRGHWTTVRWSRLHLFQTLQSTLAESTTDCARSSSETLSKSSALFMKCEFSKRRATLSSDSTLTKRPPKPLCSATDEKSVARPASAPGARSAAARIMERPLRRLLLLRRLRRRLLL